MKNTSQNVDIIIARSPEGELNFLALETEDEWIEHNDKKKTQLLTQEAKRAEAWGRSR